MTINVSGQSLALLHSPYHHFTNDDNTVCTYVKFILVVVSIHTDNYILNSELLDRLESLNTFIFEQESCKWDDAMDLNRFQVHDVHTFVGLHHL